MTDVITLFNGTTTSTTPNSYFYNEFNPFWNNGTYYYYVNSGDYKISDQDDRVVVDVLVAGVSKKDIKAYLDGKTLLVETNEVGWNGSVNITLDLSIYKISTKDPTLKLSNGVLRVEFLKEDEKKQLEIK